MPWVNMPSSFDEPSICYKIFLVYYTKLNEIK